MEPQHHILLVEDSRTQALQMEHILLRAGWRVTHAESTGRAMELLGANTFDLILIDYYLPGMRGDALCRQVRMRIDSRVVPIVILTGDPGQELELRGLESGADDFIAKSVDEAVLLVRLRALLNKTHAVVKPVAPTESDFHDARVLAVDDSRTYLAYLVEQLQSESYRVATSSNGADAIEQLRREDFDCVLVDLVMPGMDGIEVCRRINEVRRQAGKTTMVLMLTASEDNQNLARALEAGADDFVGKSSDIIVVKGRIRALLRRKFYEEEHHRRLSAELRAKQLEAEHERVQKEAAQARSALVDDLQKTAAALQRSNEELQQFTYVASHDLQEPLRMVASYVELLSRRYKDKLDDEAAEYIQFAVDGVLRMKALIRDLLAYSRVETRECKNEPVDLSSVLSDVLKNLQAAIQECNAQVVCDSLPVINGDRTQMIQLFQNLIGNAIKYRGPQTPEIHVGVRTDGGQQTFFVRDNGIGIKEEFFQRIFVIFQRLHHTAEYPGTGIGLAITKRIVERHGGRIWLESKANEGATFFFTLPAALQAKPDISADATATSGASPGLAA